MTHHLGQARAFQTLLPIVGRKPCLHVSAQFVLMRLKRRKSTRRGLRQGENMDWKFWKGEQVETRASYQDTLVEAVIAAAQGSLTAQAHQSAAVEFGAGLLERCFAVADITPESLSRATITPLMLSRMVRQIMLTGNSVSAIDTASGELLLIPAANYHVRGGVRESSWRYKMELSGPSSLLSRNLPSTSVIHVRMGSSVQEPWRGVSPLVNAGVSSAMLGRLEKRMANEANTKTGYVLPLAEGTPDSTYEALQRDLAVEGRTSLVETTAGGHGQGVRGAPQVDWQSKRIGAEFPESNIALRSDVALDVIAAMGIPAPLFHGTDGVSAREAYRLLLVSTLTPIAELIADELSRKLDTTVKITFRRLQAADIQSRARAFGSMIAAGVDEQTAMAVSGLES